MTIVGLGMDATEVARIADTLARHGDRFLRRVFTDEEIAYCLRRRNPAPHLAGRFAAKEAGMKAIGTGHAFGVLWRDLEVVRRGGPPQLQFHNAARGHFARLGAVRAHLTITHTDTLALAHVILVGDPVNPR
jgi:holo-[acyl-carrier protein] synthase